MTFSLELGQVLNKELDVLLKLKELSFNKTNLIINNEIRELEVVIKEEEALINEMGLLEAERENLLDTWGVAITTPISDIIEKIPDNSHELIQIKDKMSEEIEELQLRNKLNEDLIRENLDWIDFNINLITNLHNEPGYGKKPNNSSGSGISIFDRKV